ncbi:MAG: cytidylate kinase-like family protein [Candidatus Omnitrophota bacterium]|jgi:cytidylate kinase|nr:MAG: cytidylate kinase-like family protein [Candidatus Omnitrophota bacterium]
MHKIHQMVSRQVHQWNLERKAYEDRKKTEQIDLPDKLAKLRPILTLSRQRGCRGSELARLIAHDLHYGLFDKEIIDYIAKHMGVQSEVVESLDEHERSELELWIQGMLSQRIVDHDDYIHALSECVKTASLRGGVVILGRGANFLLADTPSYHIRLIAAKEYRIRTIMQVEGLQETEAREEVEKTDHERALFAKRYFQKDFDNPLEYDLILNAETNTLDGIVKIVRSALLARGWSIEKIGGDKRKKDQT